MATKTNHGIVGQLVSRLLGREDRGRKNRQSVAVRGVLPFNRKPWNPFWLGLKGAPSRTFEGQSALLPHEWPDVSDYGRDDAGAIRRRTPKIPFRVRRFRKRAAASLAKSGGHTLAHAKNMVEALEQRVVNRLKK